MEQEDPHSLVATFNSFKDLFESATEYLVAFGTQVLSEWKHDNVCMEGHKQRHAGSNRAIQIFFHVVISPLQWCIGNSIRPLKGQ